MLLVNQLREMAEGPATQNPANAYYLNLLTKAADEIERLQEEIERREGALRYVEKKARRLEDTLLATADAGFQSGDDCART